MIKPDIFADIKFYSIEQGGRIAPIPSNFFSCIFVIKDQNHDGRLLLDKVGHIHPGTEKENILIKFLCSEVIISKMHIGHKFYIRDGTIIGESIVKSILY